MVRTKLTARAWLLCAPRHYLCVAMLVCDDTTLSCCAHIPVRLHATITSQPHATAGHFTLVCPPHSMEHGPGGVWQISFLTKNHSKRSTHHQVHSHHTNRYTVTTTTNTQSTHQQVHSYHINRYTVTTPPGTQSPHHQVHSHNTNMHKVTTPPGTL